MKVPRRIFLDAVSSSLRRWFAISMIWSKDTLIDKKRSLMKHLGCTHESMTWTRRCNNVVWTLYGISSCL
jgi:hypothetical protein